MQPFHPEPDIALRCPGCLHVSRINWAYDPPGLPLACDACGAPFAHDALVDTQRVLERLRPAMIHVLMQLEEEAPPCP
jgi:hypothetical protein